MHPVLRRTGELSKLLLSDLLPQRYRAKLNGSDLTPRITGGATSELWVAAFQGRDSLEGWQGKIVARTFSHLIQFSYTGYPGQDPAAALRTVAGWLSCLLGFFR